MISINIFTVALFGHREIDNLGSLEDLLTPIIETLIKTKYYVSFFIGRNGEFDEFTASVIKRAQKKIGMENSDLTLVLPYPVAKLEYYEKYYDSIIIPENLCGLHPKSAISAKNRWMVNEADLVIVYVQRNTGGAYKAMKYAYSLNKRVINVYADKKDTHSE